MSTRTGTGHLGAHGPARERRPDSHGAVITDAQPGASTDLSGRVRKYLITMGFRVACFIAAVLVHGWLRWTLVGFAVVLPYIAVVLANQTNQRTKPPAPQHGPIDPDPMPQLTAHGEPIHGETDDEPTAHASDLR